MKPSEFLKSRMYYADIEFDVNNAINEEEEDLKKILLDLDNQFIDKADILQKIDNQIKFRESEQKNNNVYRKSSDDLNEDFIEELEDLKKELIGDEK